MWIRDSRSISIPIFLSLYVYEWETIHTASHFVYVIKKRTSRANSVLGIKCKDNADSGMEFLCGYYANNKNHFYEQWKHWTSVVVAVVVVVIVILVEYTAICIKLAHNFVVDFFWYYYFSHTHIQIYSTYVFWVVVQLVMLFAIFLRNKQFSHIHTAAPAQFVKHWTRTNVKHHNF